ncbi:hypothetical protein [Arthrobacter sp. JCM 19049]|uniref:hypothetical protein n=1 Tax=Arthrobacter sp. JCM 19049 TaxID=1460643 RepID=UPI000A7277A5|nr:hypothetical protein [Arthrobacter sp. JCM 19049]
MVILFFFLKDGDRIWAFFISWTPKHYRHKWITSGDRRCTPSAATYAAPRSSQPWMPSA